MALFLDGHFLVHSFSRASASVPRSPPYSEALYDLVASERGARAYGIPQHG
jgi:hypothetical protein